MTRLASITRQIKPSQPGVGAPLAHYRWDAQAPLVVLLVDKADFRVQRFEVPATGPIHLAFDRYLLALVEQSRFDGELPQPLSPREWGLF